MSELLVEQIDYRLTPEGYMPSTPELLLGQYVPEVDYDELRKRFTEGNDTYQVTKDYTGRNHETIIFNADKIHDGLVFKPTTSFSSGLKNPANVLETALTAAINPNVAFMMWGSWGNYPTGHMSANDRRYIRQTGRHTVGDGSEEHPYRALDSYVFLLDVLEEQDLVPTHFTADQEAGRLVLPMMVEMPKDTVKGVYLNGIDGVSPKANYVASSAIEDARSRIHRRAMGDGQPGDLTPANIKEMKRLMPNIYRGIGKIAHLAPLPVFLFPVDVRDKIGVTLGYRGHKDLANLADHAVYQDLSAAMRNQETTVTAQFNRESAQHHIEDCVELGRLVMDNIPENIRSENRRIRLLIGDGTLTRSTDKPHEAARTHALALPDIMKFLSTNAATGTGRSLEQAA